MSQVQDESGTPSGGAVLRCEAARGCTNTAAGVIHKPGGDAVPACQAHKEEWLEMLKQHAGRVVWQ